MIDINLFNFLLEQVIQVTVSLLAVKLAFITIKFYSRNSTSIKGLK